MKRLAILLSIIALAGCTSRGSAPSDDPPAAPAPVGVPDSRIGLAPGTVFEQPDQPPIGFNTVEPGDSTLQPRPNAEFPPVIPHSVEELGPISLTENPCLECHAVAVAEDVGAVAVPASHHMDLRNTPGAFGDEVTGARRVCTSCHVARTDAEPLVDIVRR